MSISSRSPSSLAGSQVSPVMSKLMQSSPRQVALSYLSGFQMSGMSLVLSGGSSERGVVVADDADRPVAERDGRGIAGVVVAGVVAAAVDGLERTAGILVQEAADHLAQAGVLAQQAACRRRCAGRWACCRCATRSRPSGRRRCRVAAAGERPLPAGTCRACCRPGPSRDARGRPAIAGPPCTGRRRSAGPCRACGDSRRWRGSRARSSRRPGPTSPSRDDRRRRRCNASGRPRGTPCGTCSAKSGPPPVQPTPGCPQPVPLYQ